VVRQSDGGGAFNIEYTFFWQGNSADMRYSISRKPPPDTTTKPPEAPLRPN
jgi:hypothetical protein